MEGVAAPSPPGGLAAGDPDEVFKSRCAAYTAVFVVLTAGCYSPEFSEDAAGLYSDTDRDGDGWPEGRDCDDFEETVYPGAPEICDDIDNDCDGLVDLASPDLDTCTIDAHFGIIAGDRDDDWTATHLGAPGDLTGDGLADLVIGSPGMSSRGHDGGIITVSEGPFDDHALVRRTGTNIGGPEGGGRTHEASPVGDIDGDGFEDLALWDSRVDTEDVGAEFDGGAVWFVYGPVTDPGNLADNADALLPAEYAGPGMHVERVGDPWGVGRDVVALSTPSDDTVGIDSGAVRLFKGPIAGTTGLGWAWTTITGTISGHEVGQLARMGPGVESGDLDGDGLADLIIGIPRDATRSSDAGAVAVFHSPEAVTVTTDEADQFMAGLDIGEAAGTHVVVTPDVNGDGVVDLLVLAPKCDRERGAVYLLTGEDGPGGAFAHAAATLVGSSPGHRLGGGLTSVGDINGDGHPDIAVGSPGENAVDEKGIAQVDSGVVRVFLGPLSGTVSEDDARATLLGRQGDSIGSVMVGPGDVTGDGVPDLVLGVPT